MAAAVSQSSGIFARWAAISARTRFRTLPPASRCASIMSVPTSTSPACTAMILVSTITDGLTLRRLMNTSVHGQIRTPLKKARSHNLA